MTLKDPLCLSEHQDPGCAPQAQRVCTIRDSRGDDEMAACGQLGSLEEENPLLPLDASALA